MALFGALMIATYVGIAHERIHKTTAALLGAGLAILFGIYLGVFTYPAVYDALRDDLNVLGVIVGTGILVDVTSRSGLFQFIGIKIVKASGGDRTRLFLYLNLLTFLFVSFLTIVPSMLIVVSLTLVACRVLEYDPKPFLISEAIVANSGALMTYASSVPNLIIGTAADIPYVQFLTVSAPFAVLGWVLAYLILRFMSRRALGARPSKDEVRELEERVRRFDEWSVVRDVAFFRRSGIILLTTIVGFAVSRQLGVGLDFIALAGATAALLLSGVDIEEAIREVNWSIVLFFAGLFTLIAAVEATGLLEAAATGMLSVTGGSAVATAVLLLWFSAGASGIVDNIPVAATLVPIVSSLGQAGVQTEPLWWSVILGANLGGSSTPVGSISCVIALHTLESEVGDRVTWAEFIKIGGIVMVVQMLAATGYLFLMMAAGLIPSIPG